MSDNLKNILKFVAVVAVIILALFLFIFVGNTIYKYTNFYINIPDIYNKEIFAFAGSVLGGLGTLLALYITVQYFRDQSVHQTYIQQLDKEKESIFDAVSKINPLIASNLYNQYSTLPKDVDDYKRVQVLEIRRDINFQREQLMFAKTELQLKSDILDEYDKCLNCNKKCGTVKYSERFRKQYNEAEKIIYNFLLNLDQFIEVSSQNDEYQAIVNQLNKQLEAPRLTVAVKEDLAGQIAKYESAIKDAQVLIGEITLDMTAISQIHMELKSKLVYTAKGYYFAKMREEHRAVKSNDTKCKQAKR